MGDWPKAFFQATESIVSGSIDKPEILYLTLNNDSVSILWNDAIKSTLPDEVISAAEKAIQDIKDGKIDVPNEYELS